MIGVEALHLVSACYIDGDCLPICILTEGCQTEFGRDSVDETSHLVHILDAEFRTRGVTERCVADLRFRESGSSPLLNNGVWDNVPCATEGERL